MATWTSSRPPPIRSGTQGACCHAATWEVSRAGPHRTRRSLATARPSYPQLLPQLPQDVVGEAAGLGRRDAPLEVRLGVPVARVALGDLGRLAAVDVELLHEGRVLFGVGEAPVPPDVVRKL